MKTLFTSFLLFVGISSCFAQQTDLSGQISIHNSRYRTGEIEYVENASVHALFAGETSSGPDGMFAMTFSGIEHGQNISLSVEKAGLEVVNERDILNVVLGRKQPLKVFLAPKSELAKRQTEFYEVSLATITKRHDAIIASLRANDESTIDAIRQLELQLNKEIADRFEAEEILNEQLEAAKERLPEMAKSLAEVNLDFASTTYRNAYETYLKGDIQAALDILNEEELSSKTEEIFTSLERIEQGQQDYQLALEIEMDKASQVYESYALKADAYELIFDYRSAVTVLRKGVELLEVVKEVEDLELADAYGVLSRTLLDLGGYAESLVYMLKNTEIKEQLLALDDPGLATSYNNLSSIYLDLGDYKQAIATQQKSIAIFEQVFEPNHPSIAIAYSNLSSIYVAFGNYKQAFTAHQKGIAILEQVFEPNHPLLAQSYNDLSVIYKDLGDYEQALAVQQKAIAIREQVFEPNHPLLAQSYSNLATIYKDLGNYAQAIATQQKAITIREQVLKPSHPSIATSYNNLSLIYQDLGDYAQALTTQQKAIAIREQVLESNHPHIASSYNNLSMVYKDLGDYAQALATQQKAIAIREQVFEPNHPDIANSYSNLSLIYRGLGDYESALTAQQKAITIREQVFEPNHPSIATSYNNLSLIYQDLGDYEQALAAQQKDIAIIKQVLGLDHPHIANSYNNLSVIYLGLGDYAQALAAQQKAIVVFEQVFGPNHIDIAAAYHNLTPIFYHQGQLDSVLVYEHLAYDIWREKLPDNHPNLQTIRRNFAFLYPIRAAKRQAEGLYQKAIEDYSEALEFSEEKGELYNSVGLCYYYTGNYERAIENYETSYQQQGLSDAVYLNNSGMAYAKWGKLEEAKGYFAELEERMPENGLTFRDWGLYYVLKNEPDTALENLEKAITLGYNNWNWLRTEEALAPLRDLPRFQALLQKAPTRND